MTLTLYMAPASPPARAVRMIAKALGLNLQLKQIDLAKKEHLSEWYIKLNPQHTVPVLDDNGFVVCDSHAIMIYLVEKYAKNDSLYPKDILKRTRVNERLLLDAGVIFPNLLATIKTFINDGKKSIEPELASLIKDSYKILEKLLHKSQWAAGESLTIADYSLLCTLTSSNVLIPIDSGKCPNICAWMKRGETLPESAVNKEGLEVFIGFMKSFGVI